jgi:hypothetical protein
VGGKMIDVMDLNIQNKSILLSNLSFDHPLTFSEINDLIKMLSSGILIGQVYFKDSIDIGSIEQIKLLLEGLPNIDDGRIEKYIMKSINDKEKEILNNMSFQNIDTWNIAYAVDKNKFSITSLSKYRVIDEWFSTTIKEMEESELSQLEKVCYLYDKVKLFQMDSSSKYSRLPEILSLGIANSYGYNLVFKELLSLCGIACFSDKYILDNEEGYITVAAIDDEKYDIHGVYLFEPSMDSISKDMYKHGLARRMNYNFFALPLHKISSLNGNIEFENILQLLSVEDDMEFKYEVNKYGKRREVKELLDIENTFNISIFEIHSKLHNTSEIGIDTFSRLFNSRVDDYSKNSEEKETLTRTIISNYKDRERELFVNKNVKTMSKIEWQCA